MNMNTEEIKDFAALNIQPDYVAKLQEMGIVQPTAVQAEAIPLVSAGYDVVAQSQTGSGKTLAYALPLLQSVDAGARELQALIIVPTRELGMQIVRTLEALTEHNEVRVQQLIGGASIQRQLDALKKKPHIAVGTPGRLVELIKLRKLNLQAIRQLVIDEVDQVFELGGLKETETILKHARRDKQLVFFSATVPPRLAGVIDQWMNEPRFVRINPKQITSETLTHLYFVSEQRDKLDMLRRIVRLQNPKAAIVFVNETEDIGELVAKLRYIGLSVDGLYGDAFKLDRVQAMQRFREGKVQLLLATDVAARGLDLPQVTHVIHLDPATDAEHYVHRAGRTGRMGRKGTSISIVTPKEQFIMDKFAKALGIRIEKKAMAHGKLLSPSEEHAIRRNAAGKPQGGAAKRIARTGSAAAEATLRTGAAGSDSAAGQRSRTKPGDRFAGNGSGDNQAAVTGTQGRKLRHAGGAPGADLARTGEQPSGQAERTRQGSAARSRKETAQQRKNKGAPRWLKAKQDGPKK